MKLIKINTDHYIVVDDSKIEIGDWAHSMDGIHQWFGQVLKTELLPKKITHSTLPLKFLNEVGFTTANLKPDWSNVIQLLLSEVKELIGEVDVEKKALKPAIEYIAIYKDANTFDFRKGYETGYNQALEDNKDKLFTVDDIKKAFEEGVDSEFMTLHMETYEQREHYRKTRLNTFIQSLLPKTEWEVEFDENGKLKLV